MDVTDDVTCTSCRGTPSALCYGVRICTEHSADSRGIGYEAEKSPTPERDVPATAMKITQDTRYVDRLMWHRPLLRPTAQAETISRL